MVGIQFNIIIIGFFLLLPISWIKGISRGNVCWVQSLYEQKIFYTSAISLVRIQENILWNNKQNFEYRAGDIFYGASYWVILGEAADMLSFFLLLLHIRRGARSQYLVIWLFGLHQILIHRKFQNLQYKRWKTLFSNGFICSSLLDYPITLLGSGSEWPKDQALLLTMVSY